MSLPQLNAKVRAILFNWLVDVAANYKLCSLILFNGVYDRPIPRLPPCSRKIVAAGGGGGHVDHREV